MLEEKYIETTSINHRKQLGQFFTPANVAKLMVEWILQKKPKRILDPAFGLGMFFREIRKINASVNVVGFEIDNYILANLEPSITGDKLLSLYNQDYLTSALEEFDAVICNPPYSRFQKFANRSITLPILQEQIGKDILGYANIASVFLLKSLHQLKQGGRLAYIMPYEFLNAGYGKKIKQIILEEDYLKSIILFENEKEIFPEAITTICVLLCEKGSNSSDISVSTVLFNNQLESIESFDQLDSIYLKKNILDPSKKWSPIFDNLHTEHSVPEGFVYLSQYGKFKRGIATGANDFFALSSSQIENWSLPKESVKLCITKSAQVRTNILTEKGLEELIDQDSNIYCLDVKDPLEANTAKYIAFGENIGVNERYLTRNRTPWYKIEDRAPSPLLFGVFSRNKYKIIRNYTKCMNFTCYHSFYPNLLGFSVVDKLFLYLLSDFGSAILRSNQRKYGAGLMKFEPNDLNECYVPSLSLFNDISYNDVERAMSEIKNSPNKTTFIANEIIAKLGI